MAYRTRAVAYVIGDCGAVAPVAEAARGNGRLLLVRLEDLYAAGA